MTAIWIIGIICAFSLGVLTGCILNAPTWEDDGFDFTKLSPPDQPPRAGSRMPW